MKQPLLTLILLTLITTHLSAQIIDKYGVNFGTSYTTQSWDYKSFSGNQSNDYKVGLSAFLSAEKKLGKVISIRPEFGYIQKGFKNNLVLTFYDGSSAGSFNQNVVLHDLAANLGLKISPFDRKFSPYVVVGLRGDYLIAYKDVVVKAPDGSDYPMYKSMIDEFNKTNLGGLISLGIEFSDLIYFEAEYNPSITSSYDSELLRIRDDCWGVKLGININKLM